jgi:hypothetical protein
MSLSDQSLKSKLSKYSKADIIDAVCNEFMADHIVHDMLIFLGSRTNTRLIDESIKAHEESYKAADAYIAWQDDMIKRYGNGKSVKSSDIPQKEQLKGAKLGDAWKKAMKKSDEAERRVSRNLGISNKPRKKKEDR